MLVSARRGLLLALACSVAAAVGGTSSAVAEPDPGATAAFEAYVLPLLPPPSGLFFSCPTENALHFPDGSTLIQCEFRAASGGLITSGEGQVETGVCVHFAGPCWYPILSSLAISRPASSRPSGCSRSFAHAGGARVKQLRAHGITCSTAANAATGISFLVAGTRSINKRFTYDANTSPHSEGLVLLRFDCRGRRLIANRHGPGNPFAVFSANCTNSFGDGFIFKFTQAS